jgi:hypothetical protein
MPIAFLINTCRRYKKIPPSRNPLPQELWQQIGTFLSYQDRAQLAQASKFTAVAVRDDEQYYQQITAHLKDTINSIPEGVLSDEVFQPLLVELVTSPATGHPKYWLPLWKKLILNNHYWTPPKTWEYHEGIADLLSGSGHPISSEQFYHFFKPLLKPHLLGNYPPWEIYKILKSYLIVSEEGVERIMTECLTKAANRLEPTFWGRVYGNRRFDYLEINISLEHWFGINGSTYSLWGPDQTEPMPELFAEILKQRIQALHKTSNGLPLQVSLVSNPETHLPRNFIFPLVQRITQANIFFDHKNSIYTAELENPFYAQSIEALLDSRISRQELFEQYPNVTQT